MIGSKRCHDEAEDCFWGDDGEVPCEAVRKKEEEEAGLLWSEGMDLETISMSSSVHEDDKPRNVRVQEINTLRDAHSNLRYPILRSSRSPLARIST